MNLKDLRKKIDSVDEKLIALLNRRGRLAQSVGRLKSKKKMTVYDPVREAKVLRRVEALNSGPLGSGSLRAIYRELISACRGLEKELTVAYLGPEATFTHEAALKQFGSAAKLTAAESISGVFREVEKGEADYGVVPIENSLEGAVTYTLDMLIDSPLKICSEIYLSVSHSLLSNSPLSRIKEVHSHPQVFGQCRLWIQKNLPGVALIEAASTAQAARIASRQAGSGALAGRLAASVYGLKVLARGIEDSELNITRFLVIGRELPAPSGKDRTSLIFSLTHRTGTLHDALSAFKRRGINLTKIESRPSKVKAWEYYFFVDLEGHCRSRKVKEALTELEKNCPSLKVLGSYPCGGV